MITLYEPLGLAEGHKLLEVGLGSGYSITVAREIVGQEGLVVSVEIDPEVFEAGRRFINSTGFHDIVLVLGDGCYGYPEKAPYDRICITAACSEIPQHLIEQLKVGGKLIAPVVRDRHQEIVLIEKGEEGVTEQVLRDIVYNMPYVRIQGEYGIK